MLNSVLFFCKCRAPMDPKWRYKCNRMKWFKGNKQARKEGLFQQCTYFYCRPMNKRSHFSLCLHKFNNSPSYMALFQSDNREIIESEKEMVHMRHMRLFKQLYFCFFLFCLKVFGENLRVLSNVDMHIYGFRILLFPAFSFVDFFDKKIGKWESIWCCHVCSLFE